MPSSRTSWVIAAALIAALFTLQSFRHAGSGPWGTDGSYYLQVARHVAAGQGLLTSVCLYDQGLRTLPAHTNIYPLWPLLLGTAARVMPLLVAATLLPRLLFAGTLALLFALARRLSGGAPFAPYAAVLLLGTNLQFFATTCYPYTEGLGLFCAVSALLALAWGFDTGEPLPYAIAGFLAGLAFLTRSQMLLLGLALAGVLAGAAALERVRPFLALVWTAGYAVAVLPWIIYLTTFIRPFSLSAMIAMHSETPELPPFDQHVATRGGLHYLLDRLSGLGVMFDPRSDLSFVHSFGLAALLVPAAAVYVLWRRRWAGGLLMTATAVAGALLCGMLLEAHNRFFNEWLFGYRHGLPLILLLLVAMAQLSGPIARWLVAGAVALSVLMNMPAVVVFATGPPPEWPSAAEAQLATWLGRNDPHAIVLSTNAQELGMAATANFRWAACEQTPEEIARVLRLVRTDYVLLYEREQRCPFAGALRQAGRPVAIFGVAPDRAMLFRVVH